MEGVMDLTGHVKQYGVIKLPAYYDKLTTAERHSVRKEYARRQGGKCCFCDMPLDGPPDWQKAGRLVIDESLFPAGFNWSSEHLHHCHQTGLTIGTVHAKCNAVLWQYHGE
jgi:hypothetical protein